jgi:polyhydroxyalkanoate synthesis regulator phasin
MLKDLKDKALSGAMKIMQTEQAQKVMNSPDVQKAMFRAFQTSMKVKGDISDASRNMAKKLNFATNDDLQDLKRTIDRLERKVRDLKTENTDLKSKVDAQAAPAAEEPKKPRGKKADAE